MKHCYRGLKSLFLNYSLNLNLTVNLIPCFHFSFATMMMLILACMLVLVTLTQAGNLTVTDEAWFDIEVKDLDGPGMDYKGKITIALFGEAAPMTTMNFVSITRGYKRGKVIQCLLLGD